MATETPTKDSANIELVRLAVRQAVERLSPLPPVNDEECKHTCTRILDRLLTNPKLRPRPLMFLAGAFLLDSLPEGYKRPFLRIIASDCSIREDIFPQGMLTSVAGKRGGRSRSPKKLAALSKNRKNRRKARPVYLHKKNLKQYFGSAEEAAKDAQVSIATIYRWINEGIKKPDDPTVRASWATGKNL